MPRLLTLAAVVLSATAGQAQPVDAAKPPAGFVPPVLQGVRGDGVARRANGPIPFPDRDERWLVARSRHFVFISSSGERRTRDTAVRLETLAAALARLSPRFSAAAAPTRVIVFSRRRESQPYFDMLLNQAGANVTGVFVTQRSGASMIINDVPGYAAAERTPFHELIHDLIAARGETRPPLWLEEGLAEYFSNAELRAKSMYAGLPVKAHMETLRLRTLLPLEELFAVQRESNTYNLPSGQAVFYAESWAVVDWLIRNSGRSRAEFYAFLSDMERGVAPADALRAHYGKSLDDLRTALVAYARALYVWSGFRMDVSDADTTLTTAPLDRAGALYELGSFLAGMREMAPEAERHFREALKVNPKHARSLAALAMLRADDRRYDESAPLFEEALAAGPNDTNIILDYAESLLERQVGPMALTGEVSAADASHFRKARELASRALARGGDKARALGDLGITYAVESDSGLAPGIAALEEAHALAPSRTDVALHLFAMYRRTDDRPRADPLFARLDALHNPQVAYALRAVILRSGLGKANALVHEQKLAEASAVLRALAAESKGDVDSALDLQRQADEIERVAEQNREIGLYNQAVHEVNTKNYRVARKMIDDLLSTAHDPDVIADARRLRDQLARVIR
jgi:tetratricopeptide (TPR) repeat protein